MNIKLIHLNPTSAVKSILCFFMACWLSGALSFQVFSSTPERLIADRPGFAWGTHATTPGKFYFESGYQYSFKTGPAYSNFPMLNFRTGIIEKLELFITWDGWDLSHHSQSNNNIQDNGSELNLPFIGSKYQIITSDSYNITLMGLLEGNDDAGKLYLNPSLALLWDCGLTDKLEIFGMGMATNRKNATDKLYAINLALGIGFPLSKRADVFAEYYNELNTDTGKFIHGNEAGIIYFISDNLQIDFFAGYGISKEIDHYTGFGLARRF